MAVEAEFSTALASPTRINPAVYTGTSEHHEVFLWDVLVRVVQVRS